MSEFTELQKHIGHQVSVVGNWGTMGHTPLNVSVECEDCYEVLTGFDYDNKKG